MPRLKEGEKMASSISGHHNSREHRGESRAGEAMGHPLLPCAGSIGTSLTVRT